MEIYSRNHLTSNKPTWRTFQVGWKTQSKINAKRKKEFDNKNKKCIHFF